MAHPLPVAPTGTGASAAPATHQAKKTKTGQGARQCTRQQGAAPRPGPGSSHAAPPHAQTPGAHQQHRPHQRPPPPGYHSTLTQQPSKQPPPTHVHAMPGSPYTQSQGTRHHQHHHHTPILPSPSPPMPQYYGDPRQLQPHHAPPQPGPTGHPPHTAPHYTAPSRIPPSPAPATRHNQHTLNTTTTRSSTTYHPEYRGSGHTDHRTPPWTRGEPHTHTGNTRA